MSVFNFKHFRIIQEKSVFKVGTDSLILAAWADFTDAKHILDIGTGTGILALAAAQKNNEAFIDAIEIDEDSVTEALTNFQNSPWKNRIKLHNINFLDFESESGIQYDVIISNPPYFSNALKNPEKRKSLSRHSDSLPFSDLAKKIKLFLHPTGIFYCILPISEMNLLELELKNEGIYMQKCLMISGKENETPIRKAAEFGFTKMKLETEFLNIRNSTGNYSAEYIEWTKDFHDRELK